MNESTLTPGPWDFAADSYGKVKHSKKACVFTTVRGERGERLQTIAQRIPNWADARAIAAVPHLVKVARHVLSMANDACLTGHPEWDEIVKDARLALADDDSIDVLCCDYKACAHGCTEDDPCCACVGRGDCGGRETTMSRNRVDGEAGGRIALTKEPRKARQFRNRKEAMDFAASIGWRRNDARRIEIMGFLLWAVCDEHMNYVADVPDSRAGAETRPVGAKP